jgi:hypothetical protein
MSANEQVKKFIEDSLDRVDVDRQRKILSNQQIEIKSQTEQITDLISRAAESEKPWIIGDMYWGK